jgi:hypothetical protein
MPERERTVGVRDLIGRRVRDRQGNHLGYVTDLVCESEEGPPARVVEALVTDGPWLRMLGYESPDERGPWLLLVLAHWITRRHLRAYPWNDLVIDE